MASIIPDAATYGEESAAALAAYQSALANISSQRSQALQSYGLTAQVDPDTGALKNYSIDPHAQFGLFQQQMGSTASQLHQLREAAGARGLGHIGLGAQDEARARLAGQGQLGALGQQAVGTIGNLASQQLGARQTYDNALVQAQRDALAQAIANGLFTPAPAQATSTDTAPPPPPSPPTVPRTTSGVLIGTKQKNPYTVARAFSGGAVGI